MSGGEDKTIYVWNIQGLIKSKKPTATFEEWGIARVYGHRASITSLAYNCSGDRLATASADQTVKLWNTRKNTNTYGQPYKKVATLSSHSKGVNAVAFSKDADFVVSGGDDKLVHVHEAQSAKIHGVWKKHTQSVVEVVATSVNNLVLSASTDQTCTLWNVATGQAVCSFAAYSRLTCVASANDALYFAIGDGSGGLYLLKPVDL